MGNLWVTKGYLQYRMRLHSKQNPVAPQVGMPQTGIPFL